MNCYYKFNDEVFVHDCDPAFILDIYEEFDSYETIQINPQSHVVGLFCYYGEQPTQWEFNTMDDLIRYANRACDDDYKLIEASYNE